jgi:hypothetical protein
MGAIDPKIEGMAEKLGVGDENLKAVQQMSSEDLKGMGNEDLAEKLGLGEDFREGKRMGEIKEFMERVKQSGSTPGSGR